MTAAREVIADQWRFLTLGRPSARPPLPAPKEKSERRAGTGQGLAEAQI